TQELAYAQQPLPDIGVQTRIDEGYTPIVQIAAVQLDCAAAAAQREIVGERLVVVEKVLANHVAAVTEAQNELRVAVMRVIPHEVPEDRTNSDVDQRLRNRVGVLSQSGAESAAEKHYLHRQPPNACTVLKD